jgi:hypothetical protein
MQHSEDAFLACAIVLSIMSSACETNMGDKQDGQPCTRSDQCAPGLVCSGGSCLSVNADAGERDAGPSDDKDAGRKDAGGK